MNRLIPLCVAGAMLAACATAPRFAELATGQSTRAEVVSRHGEPTRSWQNADGSQVLLYASQPYGTTTHIVTLGPDGRLRSVEETLSEQGRGKIARGMSKEEVAKWLGPPRSVQRFARSGEEVWDWNIATVYMRMEQRYNVHFKEDRVVSTSITNVFPRDRLDDF